MDYKIGDKVHLAFGKKGGAGFHGHIVRIKGDKVRIRHASGRQYEGPTGNLTLVKPAPVMSYPIHGKHSRKPVEPVTVDAYPVHGNHASKIIKEDEERPNHLLSGDVDKIHEELTEKHKPYHDGHEEDERKALRKYTDSSAALNRHLIDRHSDEDTISSHHDNHVKHLDSALNKTSAHKDMIVYHGAGFDPDEFARQHPDRHINLPAFTSTSISRSTAVNFSRGHLLKIKVPKGTKGLYLGDNSEHPGEKEFIMPRNTVLKVHHTPIHGPNGTKEWEATVHSTEHQDFEKENRARHEKILPKIEQALENGEDNKIYRHVQHNHFLEPKHIQKILDNEGKFPMSSSEAWRHPSLPKEKMDEALDPEHRYHRDVLSNPGLTKDHLKKYIEDQPHNFDRIKEHPNMDDDTLIHALKSDVWQGDVADSNRAGPKLVDHALKEHPELLHSLIVNNHKAVQPKHISAILNDPDNEELAHKAMGHWNASPENIEAGLAHSNPAVQKIAIRHHRATPEIISKALDHGNDDVVREAVRRTSSADDINKILKKNNVEHLTALATNSNLNAEQARKLIRHENADVSKIAWNSHGQHAEERDLLDGIKKGAIDEWHLDSHSDKLKSEHFDALLKHDGANKKRYMRIAARLAKDKKHLDHIIDHGEYYALSTLSTNKHLQPEHLHKLFDGDLAEAAINHPNADHDLLMKGLKHHDTFTRSMAAGHKNIDNKHIEWALKDGDAGVIRHLVDGNIDKFKDEHISKAMEREDADSFAHVIASKIKDPKMIDKIIDNHPKHTTWLLSNNPHLTSAHYDKIIDRGDTRDLEDLASKFGLTDEQKKKIANHPNAGEWAKSYLAPWVEKREAMNEDCNKTNPDNRQQGTDKLTKIYKKDTPGQVTEMAGYPMDGVYLNKDGHKVKIDRHRDPKGKHIVGHPDLVHSKRRGTQFADLSGGKAIEVGEDKYRVRLNESVVKKKTYRIRATNGLNGLYKSVLIKALNEDEARMFIMSRYPGYIPVEIKLTNEGHNYEVMTNETKQLDEISKKTLGSYIKKAADDMVKAKQDSDYHTRRGNEDYMKGKPMAKVNDSRSKAAKLYDRYYKRRDGIETATKKLTKEETDHDSRSNEKDYPDLRDYEFTAKQPTRLGQFLRLHKIKKRADINGNKDDVFKAANVKTDKRAPHHGYDHEKDAEAYM